MENLYKCKRGCHLSNHDDLKKCPTCKGKMIQISHADTEEEATKNRRIAVNDVRTAHNKELYKNQ